MNENTKLVSGQVYKTKVFYDGHSPGTLVVFKWMTKDNKWAICNPVGEPSMQDSLCLDPETELEIV